jgi:hypothetical protein
LAVVADSTVEVILATGRQGRSRLTRLMGWEPVQQADLRTNLAEVRSYGACPRLAWGMSIDGITLSGRSGQ